MIADLQCTSRNHQQSYNFGCSLKKMDGTGGLHYLNSILNLFKENQDNESTKYSLIRVLLLPWRLKMSNNVGSTS